MKALPILSLVWLVCLQGVGLGEPVNHCTTYNRRILCGLLLSCIGDVFLIWQEELIFFIMGMACFGCAQTFYIRAFGFSPFGLKEMVLCYSGFLFILASVFPCLPNAGMSFAVTVYALLVTTMAWRSIARFNLKGDIPWRKIFSAVGAFLFSVSDVILVVNKFCCEVPFEHRLIMTTYYGAQLCISLSVINYHLHGNEVRDTDVVMVQSSPVLESSSPPLRQRDMTFLIETKINNSLVSSHLS